MVTSNLKFERICKGAYKVRVNGEWKATIIKHGSGRFWNVNIPGPGWFPFIPRVFNTYSEARAAVVALYEGA